MAKLTDALKQETEERENKVKYEKISKPGEYPCRITDFQNIRKSDHWQIAIKLVTTDGKFFNHYMPVKQKMIWKFYNLFLQYPMPDTVTDTLDIEWKNIENYAVELAKYIEENYVGTAVQITLKEGKEYNGEKQLEISNFMPYPASLETPDLKFYIENEKKTEDSTGYSEYSYENTITQSVIQPNKREVPF